MIMRTRLSSSIAGLLLVVGSLSPADAAPPELKTDEQKTLYALGVVISQNLSGFRLSAAELELVQAGLADGTLGREQRVDLATYGPKIQGLQQARLAAAAVVEKQAGEAFIARAAAERGAVKTASGLVITTLRAGSGEAPKATDRVRVHYHGTLVDGTVFDSSVSRGQPVTFGLNEVIRCWTEGVPLMKVGGKSRLVCPADLAYGDRGAPPRIKPGATLVFEVELLEIVR